MASYSQSEYAKNRQRPKGGGVVRLSDEETRQSRRSILVNAKRAAYLLGGGYILDKIGAFDSPFGNTSFAGGVDKAVESKQAVSDIQKENSPLIVKKDLIASSFGKDQNGEIRREVDKYKSEYQGLDFGEVFLRTSKFDVLVRDKIGNLGLPPEVADLVMGQIIVESSGDKWAVSESGARGIVQIMEDMARAYQMGQVTGDQNDIRHQEEPSMVVLSKELKKSFERWGNWSFSFWEWHAGAPVIYSALGEYANEKLGVRLPGVDVPSNFPHADLEAKRRVDLYKSLIEQNNLNVHEVFKAKNVQKKFEGKGWDQTEEYSLRVVATAELYRDNRSRQF